MMYTITRDVVVPKEPLLTVSQLGLGEIAEIVEAGDCGKSWVGGYCWRFPGNPTILDGECLYSLWKSGDRGWVQKECGMKLRRLPPGTFLTFIVRG